MVLEQAIADDRLRERLVAIFNDLDVQCQDVVLGES